MRVSDAFLAILALAGIKITFPDLVSSLLLYSFSSDDTIYLLFKYLRKYLNNEQMGMRINLVF